MRRTTTALVAILAVAAAALLLIGPAAAQAQENATQAENGTQGVPDGEQIDGNTILTSSDYDPATQTASVTIYSETLQQVTITDVSPYMDGGVMRQRTVTLKPGQERTIEIPVEPADNGFVGLSIATNDKLYSVPLERPGIALRPPEPNDAMALLIGVSLPVFGGRAVEWYHARKRKRGVVRIDG